MVVLSIPQFVSMFRLIFFSVQIDHCFSVQIDHFFFFTSSGKMKKETQKKNMSSHVKGQRGGSWFELPVVKSSAELVQSYKIKREERMADLEKTKARINEVEAPSIKPNHPPTNN